VLLLLYILIGICVITSLHFLFYSSDEPVQQLIQSDRRETYHTAIQCMGPPSTGSYVMSVCRFYRILETFNNNPLRYSGQHDKMSTFLYI
jgi:hypothetical protein